MKAFRTYLHTYILSDRGMWYFAHRDVGPGTAVMSHFLTPAEGRLSWVDPSNPWRWSQAMGIYYQHRLGGPQWE